MNLIPTSDPPTRWARWCPRCCEWLTSRARRRCPQCGAAVVRQVSRHDRALPGEHRPGVVAEFLDPRDRYDAGPLIASLRARLKGNYEAVQ